MVKKFNKGIFSLPYLIICILFVVFPLVLLMIYSFQGTDGRFTFQNFIDVFTNSTNYMVLLKTIGIAVLSTVITLLIAYPVALVLASSPFNKYVILALLIVVPMWINFVLRIYALQTLLDFISIKKGLAASVIGIVYDFLPFMILPIYTVLLNMDKSYTEASCDLGANTVNTFLRVTLPLSVPGVISGILMVFMPVFSAYAITDILGKSGVNLIGGKINYLISANQWGLGSALAFVLLVLVIGVMLLANVLTKRKTKTAQKSASLGGGRLL